MTMQTMAATGGRSERRQEPAGAAARAWSDEQIQAAALREGLDFHNWPAAIASARERWGLFERLREVRSDPGWADLPSQEAFATPWEAGLERAVSEGLIAPAPADELPSQSSPGLISCSLVKAAGQAASDRAFAPPPFLPDAPALSARAGDESLALLALEAGADQTARRVRAGVWSAHELRASFEARIARVEPGLGSLERLCSFEGVGGVSPAGPLAGVPFAAKSLFWVQGEIASASSAMLSRFRAPIDAPVVSGLRLAGASPIALARMDEMGMGSDGSRSAWGATGHPFLEGRLPGGSSSGSAAALAAGLCLFSIGSDTGGSIRQPASHCGLWGLKPTYGALSRFGMVPYAFSLDCPGAMARSARDLALVYEAMASGPRGWDERQALWSPQGLSERIQAAAAAMGSPGRPWEGLSIGVERSLLAGCDAPAREAFAEWEERARAAGARVVDIFLPAAESSVWAYYLLASCEAQSALARYSPERFGWEAEAAAWPDWESAAMTARRDLLGLEPRLRALAGAMALSEPSRESLYAKACSVRSELSGQWALSFDQVDFVCVPSTSGPAPKAGEPLLPEIEWAQDRLTIPASLGGIGAISAPWALRSDGEPMGIQLCLPWHREAKAFAACLAFQAGLA